MNSDPVVDEIRRIREEIAARFNYDMDAIFRHFQERTVASGRPVAGPRPRAPVDLPPRSPKCHDSADR